MVEILAILIAISCSLLTYATIGLLRRAADLRLYLTGHTLEAASEAMLLDAGFQIPPQVVNSLFLDPHHRCLVLFVSNTCQICENVLDEINHADSLPMLINICPVDGTLDLPSATGSVRDAQVKLLSPESAMELARHLRISETPIAIIVHDGYIVGSSLREYAASLPKLAELWGSTAGLTTS